MPIMTTAHGGTFAAHLSEREAIDGVGGGTWTPRYRFTVTGAEQFNAVFQEAAEQFARLQRKLDRPRETCCGCCGARRWVAGRCYYCQTEREGTASLPPNTCPTCRRVYTVQHTADVFEARTIIARRCACATAEVYEVRDADVAERGMGAPVRHVGTLPTQGGAS